MRLKITEQQLVNLVIEYLCRKRCFVWRNNTAFNLFKYTTKSGENKTRALRSGIKGSSDIIGLTRLGKFIAVECKIGNNKTTPEQDLFLHEVGTRGGLGIVAYSLDDVIDRLGGEL